MKVVVTTLTTSRGTNQLHVLHHHQRIGLCSTQQQQRYLSSDQSSSSSSSSSKSSSYRYIPEPTWSIDDLELKSNHPKLPKEEIQRLSHRALIQIIENNNTEGDDEQQQLQLEQEQLEQDLANMMHMVELVSNFNDHHVQEDDDEAAAEESDNDESGVNIYDSVRGVTSAPLRRNSIAQQQQQQDQHEANEVWKAQLQPNTTKVGGSHEYFVITTKEEEK